MNKQPTLMQPQFCKNCEHTSMGNFCSNCGQKAHTVRINLDYVKDEIKYTFLHINKGFLYTAKQLFTRPGDAIREFIDGKRVQHYKPILMVFVLAGLSGFLSLFIDYSDILKATANSQNEKLIPYFNKGMNWMFSHYALLEILALPIVSFFSWIAFKKWGYNYFENIIINSFSSAQRLLLTIAFFPFYYIGGENIIMIVGFVAMFIIMGLTVWNFIGIYRDKSPGNVILRILLYFFMLFTTYMIIIIASMVGLIMYLD
ncbi:MAG: DUF3667 domain-containing protein, partial [Bacteroidota bacterium]